MLDLLSSIFIILGTLTITFGMVGLLRAPSIYTRLHAASKAVALGVVSLYGLAIVTVSFYLKRWIGQRVWRGIHYGSFGVFLASLIHGVRAGTDSSEPLVIGLYVGAVVAVVMLTAYRAIPVRGGRASVPS